MRTDFTLTSVQKWNDEILMLPAHACGVYGIRKKVDNSANWRDEPIHPVKNGSAGTEMAFISGRGICDGLPRASADLLGFGSEQTFDGTLFLESELGSRPLPGLYFRKSQQEGTNVQNENPILRVKVIVKRVRVVQIQA